MVRLKEHWESNRNNWLEEEFADRTTFTNFWESPSYMVDLSEALQEETWDFTKHILEDWTGHGLARVSLYGIRAYTEGKNNIQRNHFSC